MKATTFIVVLLLTSVSFANVPLQLKKSAGYNFARALLKECNSSNDALQCLDEMGSECSPVAGDNAEQYRCEFEFAVDFTKQRSSSRPPDAVQRYQAVFRLVKSSKGWSGNTQKVTLLAD